MVLFGFSFDHDEFFPYNDESEDEGRKPVDRKPRDVASRIGSALRPQTRRMVTVTSERVASIQVATHHVCLPDPNLRNTG